MRVKSFRVPLYGHRVTLVEIEGVDDHTEIGRVMSRLKINKEESKSVSDEIRRGKYDGAYTYRNMEIKEFMVIMFPMTSDIKRVGVLGHEKRHIEDRIAEHCGIDDIEAMGYLAGFLTEKLFS